MAVGAYMYVLGHILHTAAHRKVRLPLVLIKLMVLRNTGKTTLYIPNIHS